MPSSRRLSGSPKRPKVPPEMIHQLSRALLSFSLKKLNEQNAAAREPAGSSSKGENTSSRPRSSTGSKPRATSTASKRAGSRDTLRDAAGGDLHNLISQLAVGVFAFGMRHLIKRRREAKRAAEAAGGGKKKRSKDKDKNGSSIPTSGLRSSAIPGDPELSSALDTVARELQGATESIRRLAATRGTMHRNCPVRDALNADADRLTDSLVNMQASIHNMRNLHPGLERARRRSEREERRREKRERRERREREEGVRVEEEAKEEEGRRKRRREERGEDGRRMRRREERPEERKGARLSHFHSDQ
ncbi:hypothetical protein C8A05DRAFT_30966 [Staphylotrichum tortipilum]|uniref:Uncharacterized protein n=1 Tax=Staphylotrichum tortipilum TaxID=2831512 RepID=A0AAN6MRS1_9PEZI|nr:hypothetical protein C8A05DRAFT_30966 [Staphylotrichum longicolle]